MTHLAMALGAAPLVYEMGKDIYSLMSSSPGKQLPQGGSDATSMADIQAQINDNQVQQMNMQRVSLQSQSHKNIHDAMMQIIRNSAVK